MKALQICIKTLKETYRRPRALAITLGIPVAFMFIFGLAFGSEDPTTYEIGVQSDDRGGHAEQFLLRLEAAEHVDGSRVFQVDRMTTLDAAEFDVGLQFPSDFSSDVAAGRTVDVALHVRSADVTGQTARQILSAMLDDYVRSVQGAAEPVRIERVEVGEPARTAFDFIAPGLMVFAILNIIPTTAAVLAREVESGTLDRVRMTPTRSASLLGGVALAQLVLAAFSLALMLVAARLMGFQSAADFGTVYVIAMLAGLSVVGLGLMVASFVRRQDEAAGIATAIAVPASFLSGAFFPVPGINLFRLGNTTVGLYDILPTTHATAAMRATMTFGESLGDVWERLAVLAALSLLFFAVGVGLFAWRRMRPT